MTSGSASGLMLLVLVVAGCSTALAADAPRPRVEGLVVEPAGEGFEVSFHVSDGITDEILERIHSGLEVGFRFRIELLARRGILPDKTLGRTVVQTTVAFDSLTRQYSLVRRVDARAKRRRRDSRPLEQRWTTDSREEMQTWMSQLSGIPLERLEDAADPSARRRVRVESNLGRRWVLVIFPATVNPSAELWLDP